MAVGTPPIQADVVNVARIITDPAPPPEWLQIGMISAVNTLSGLLPYVDAYPTRAKLRSTLDDARKAATLLFNTLNDYRLLLLIEAARAERADTPVAISTLFGFVSELHGVALPALSDAHDSIRPGKGRDQHLPNPDGLSPREFCAAWIAVAWSEVHVCAIPHTSRRAHNACEALWIAAGGELTGWGSTKGAWRSALEIVKEDRHADRMQSLRRDFDAAKSYLQLNSSV